MPTVKTATEGQTGFDVNQVLSSDQAAAFKSAGMTFCIRYVPRQLDNFRYNLTNAEMGRILGAGLALGVVQHVSPDDWSPTFDLGKQYGEYAAEYCLKTVQLPEGVTVWLDLEMVNKASTVSDIINYCDQWFTAITAAGYKAGLYVGYQCGLNPDELYHNLPFLSYWKSYNYDDGVATRGFQLFQHTEKNLNGITFDPNIVQADNVGDLPIFLFP
jgi:hypothetical protein